MTNPAHDKMGVLGQKGDISPNQRARVKFPIIVSDGNYIINPTPAELDDSLWGTDDENAVRFGRGIE
jgi:hypothetical protein